MARIVKYKRKVFISSFFPERASTCVLEQESLKLVELLYNFIVRYYDSSFIESISEFNIFHHVLIQNLSLFYIHKTNVIVEEDCLKKIISTNLKNKIQASIKEMLERYSRKFKDYFNRILQSSRNEVKRYSNKILFLSCKKKISQKIRKEVRRYCNKILFLLCRLIKRQKKGGVQMCANKLLYSTLDHSCSRKKLACSPS